MKTTLLEENNCRLLIAELTESIEELLPLLDNFDEYATEFKQISTTKRKKEFISVRILVNILMQKNVVITYNNDHKPLLTNSDTHISISHSGNLVAIIASETPVGVDIEGRTTRVEKVSKRYLDAEELLLLYPENGNTEGLELAWSGKEAMYKCIGRAASNFHTLKILPFEIADSGQFKAVFIPSGREFDLFFKINTNYTLVYCY